MISVTLQGGLGNAMFQIASIEYMGEIWGQPVCYPNVDNWIRHITGIWDGRASHAEEYISIFANLDLKKNWDERYSINQNVIMPFHYKDIEPRDGDNFIGYFQSELNFPDRNFVKELFIPSSDIAEVLYDYNDILDGITCSIHVRRGDYLSLPHHHPILRSDYYYKAIELLKPLKIDQFLVFSDDMDWATDVFQGDEFHFITAKDYYSLFLMSRCNHHIIANSAFSWWGAYLGTDKNSVTIAPEQWFGDAYPEDHADDIIPQSWIKL
jgi:hypothetical protein